MPEQSITTKVEKAIIAFLSSYATEGEPLDGVEFYEGHGATDMDTLPRIIVTSASDNEFASAQFECGLEIQILNDASAADLQAAHEKAVRAILAKGNLTALLIALNAPGGDDPDEREVKGFGISGLRFDPPKGEGRDQEKNLHGVLLKYTAWCHLEAEE